MGGGPGRRGAPPVCARTRHTPPSRSAAAAPADGASRSRSLRNPPNAVVSPRGLDAELLRQHDAAVAAARLEEEGRCWAEAAAAEQAAVAAVAAQALRD